MGMSDSRIRQRPCYQPGVNHYTYRVAWSPYLGEYVGTCLELPYVRRQGGTAQEAMGAIEEAVDWYIASAESSGETLPTPMADRHYSGTIVVRTSPELHSRLAMEAAEQRVSMNQWVVQKLSGRRPSETFGLSGFD
ncbi:pilus biosynthesis protein HicB [Mycobacterium avium subsp. hominissuis 10-4249]|nr:pilus biosynthesis protein HicB [Mycobacterium avium subsp. hominissuis 10-4249]